MVCGAYSGSARADMCFGGGGRDGEDPAKGTAGEAGEAATSALTRPSSRRYAGGGLVFVGALGSLWLLGRRKNGDSQA